MSYGLPLKLKWFSVKKKELNERNALRFNPEKYLRKALPLCCLLYKTINERIALIETFLERKWTLSPAWLKGKFLSLRLVQPKWSKW